MRLTQLTTEWGLSHLPPFVNKKYYIELENNHRTELPEIFPSGMVLSLLKQESDTLYFSVSQTDNIPIQEISLVGQMRGDVYCVAQGKLKNELVIKIPTNNFPYQGIAEFALLNGQIEPVAERLVYLHPDNKLNITAEPVKKSF